MKKFLVLLISCFIISMPAFAKTDKLSEDYLKSHKHCALMNPLAESIAQKIIKKSINKEAKGKYKVKFEGYTLSSMKQGIFKNLEITGKNINADGVTIPYMYLKTITDYNWVDYSKDPIIFKSDITFDYKLHLSEDSINSALKSKDYQKVIQNVNKIVYPVIVIKSTSVKIKNEKIYMTFAYNFPIKTTNKDKTFVVTSGVKVANGKLKLQNLGLDNEYGNATISKLANIINLLDPLSFTLNLLDEKKCNGKIENIKIVDNIIQINGKIYVKADN